MDIFTSVANIFSMVFNSTFFNIFVAILVFSLLIFIHELGHFSVAKWMGVKVDQFALGMGPPIFKRKKGETTYAIRAIPIGGYVAVEGEDEESDDERSLGKQPVWKRMIFVLAGSVMNLLLGFVLMTILVGAFQPVLTSTEIAGFSDNALSAQTGLKVGDKIKSMDGSPVFVDYDIIFALMRNSSGVMDIKVNRDSKNILLKDVRFYTEKDEQTGISYSLRDFGVESRPKNIFSVIKQSFLKSISIVRLVWYSIFDLVTGRVGVNNLAGPVGTTGVIVEAAKSSFVDLLYIITIFTINLGVFNLLPVPALDGSRFIFLVIEGIRGRPIKPKHEGIIHLVGFVLLISLILFVTYNDIMRLIGWN